MKTWEELKQQGSAHYKTGGGVEPIDLYRDMGIFRPWAIAEICQHALRNRGLGPDANPVSNKDMDKIIDYAQKLKAACGETPDPESGCR